MNEEIFYLTDDLIETLGLDEQTRQDIQYLQGISTYTILVRAHPDRKNQLGFPLLVPTAIPRLTAENVFRIMRIQAELIASVNQRNKEAKWCKCAMRSEELEAQIDACREAWAAQRTFGDMDHPMSKSEMEAHVEKIENEMRRIFRKEPPRRWAASLSEANCLNCDCPRQIDPRIAYRDEGIWRNVINVLGLQGMVLGNFTAEATRLGNELYDIQMVAPSQKKMVENFIEATGLDNMIRRVLGSLNSLLESLFRYMDQTFTPQETTPANQPSPEASIPTASNDILPTASETGGASSSQESAVGIHHPVYSNDLQPQTLSTASDMPNVTNLKS